MQVNLVGTKIPMFPHCEFSIWFPKYPQIPENSHYSFIEEVFIECYFVASTFYHYLATGNVRFSRLCSRWLPANILKMAFRCSLFILDKVSNNYLPYQ